MLNEFIEDADPLISAAAVSSASPTSFRENVSDLGEEFSSMCLQSVAIVLGVMPDNHSYL